MSRHTLSVVAAGTATTAGWRGTNRPGHAGGVGNDGEADPGGDDVRTWTIDEANAALGWVVQVVARFR